MTPAQVSIQMSFKVMLSLQGDPRLVRPLHQEPQRIDPSSPSQVAVLQCQIMLDHAVGQPYAGIGQSTQPEKISTLEPIEMHPSILRVDLVMAIYIVDRESMLGEGIHFTIGEHTLPIVGSVGAHQSISDHTVAEEKRIRGESHQDALAPNFILCTKREFLPGPPLFFHIMAFLILQQLLSREKQGKLGHQHDEEQEAARSSPGWSHKRGVGKG